MSRDWSRLSLSEMTWGERAQATLSGLAALVVSLIMAGGVLYAIGESVEGISRYNSEHNRCLQQATNGMEIKQCR